MSGRTQPISAFFKRKATKPNSDDTEKSEGSATKKGRLSSPVPEERNSESKAQLSPEVKDRIEANRLKALKTIAVKKGTPSKELMGISWKRVLQMEFEKVYFKKLLQFMESEKKLNRKVYPPIQDVYSWSDYCAFEDVKVVILGQDPYHGPGQAHGLAFSVRKGQRIPPSLLNMYKELETDIDGFVRPKHGYLASWASQGVLMLNAALTVLEGSPKSHAGKGWEQLTQAIVDALNARRSNLVFLCWGKDAQTRGKKIDTGRHKVLNSVHPSPLSASRGFFGSKPFSQANTFLKSRGEAEIDWTSVMRDTSV